MPEEIVIPDDSGGEIGKLEHPRILLKKGEENQIALNMIGDEKWMTLHQGILSESDNIIVLQPVERILSGRRLLDISREALRRIFYLSYSYRMTSDKKYSERAEKEMVAISKFTDWNPSHFLDVAEMTTAFAIGYDWLFETLSEESRATIKDAILKKGLEPSLDTQYNEFLNLQSNWNQVCNAGMTYGALAVYEDYPELAQSIIDRSIESVKKSMPQYAPDGTYPEGYGYWDYGTTFNVLLISAMEKAFNDDFGLPESKGFMKTAEYMTHMVSPSSFRCFNFADSKSTTGIMPAMFWFSKKVEDTGLLFNEAYQLSNINANTYTNRLLPAVMIWGIGVKTSTIKTPEKLVWAGQGKSPVAMMRTSWKKEDNPIYLTLKAGSPAVSHNHMDIGSFIIETDGIRWGTDFGTEDYTILEANNLDIWNYNQGSDRWTVFRNNNKSHNTLTVNNRDQQAKGTASIRSYSSSKDFKNAITDLSAIYSSELKKSVRGVAIVDDSYVVIQDEIENTGKDAIIQWRMATEATASITNDYTITLSQSRKTLKIIVDPAIGATLKTWSTKPSRSYENQNTGTTMVGFEIKIPANGQKTLLVKLLPGNVTTASKTTPPLDQWSKD